MRPLVWWVQDHLGLAAIGLLGAAAVVVAIVLLASGGSSEAPSSASKVAADRPAEAAQGSADGAGAPAEKTPAQRVRAHAAAPHHRRAVRHQKAKPTHAAGPAKPSTPGKSPAGHAAPTHEAKPPQSSDAAGHSLGKATAEKVAAAHPGVSCPRGYSTKQCGEAVEAAVAPAPPVTITQPSDCTKAISEAQCEELFAAEAAARAAGGASISPQECIEDPEQEKCTAVVEQMKVQYEAAHPGG
jgi:hypothetical protein